MRLFAICIVFFSLGDDNTYSVADRVKKWFNFESIQGFFASINLKYTPADKSDNVFGTMTLEYASIGKRKWVYCEESDYWFCPIEKPSILKMLTIGVESKALSPIEHRQAVIDSALIELVQYGRSEFETQVSNLRSLFPDCEYSTFDHLRDRQTNPQDDFTPWADESAFIGPLESTLDWDILEEHVFDGVVHQ
jgi:hypothetical protein